jgi:WD40 repeat protein
MALPPKQRNLLLMRARTDLASPSGSGRPMSRQELADLVSQHLDRAVDGKYIARLERGDYRWPSERTRRAIRQVLGAETDADLGFFIVRSARTPDLTGRLAAGHDGESSDIAATSGVGDQYPGRRANHSAKGGVVAIAPAPPDRVVDRSAVLVEVVDLLRRAKDSGAHRLVGICGPGGFGKTTVAAQVCSDPRVEQLFSEIVWVETGEQCSSGRLVQLVSDLCFQFEGNRPALADPDQAGLYLARVLASRNALIVVDNVWSSRDLAPFLLGGPQCVRLVTTRNVSVCPQGTDYVRLGPMPRSDIAELVRMAVPEIGPEAADVAEFCGGWPLLAAIVAASIAQDVAAGANVSGAVAAAVADLRSFGPQAFDVWDADHRVQAIGQAISSSLNSLERVQVQGSGTGLRERYLSLAVFPAATQIPISVLAQWWATHGWSDSAVRQFCRVLAQRSLIGAYLADRQTIMLHDVFRSYLRHLQGPHLSTHHASLADAYRIAANGDWPALETRHEYVWRFLPYHLGGAGLTSELLRVVADPNYLVTKVATFGWESLTVDQHALMEVNDRDHEADSSIRGSLPAASAMVDSAFLLHGLDSRADIAATLLVFLLRSSILDTATQRLREILVAEQHPLEVRAAFAATSGPAATMHEGHAGSVTSVAVDGDLVVTGGEDGTVRMWSLARRHHVRACRAHTGWVYAVAISPERKLVASAGDDALIRLWSSETGEPHGVLDRHHARVRALTFACAGTIIISGGEDGQALVWNVDQLDLTRALEPPGFGIWSVAVDHNGDLVATVGEDNAVRLHSLHTGRLTDTAAMHSDWVRTVAFAPDRPALASGSGDRSIGLWDIRGGRLEPVGQIDAHTRVRDIAWIPGGLLVAGGEDATLRLHDGQRVIDSQHMPAEVDWIRSVAYSSAGTVAGCEDGSVWVWPHPGPGAGDNLYPIGLGTEAIWSLAYADYGHILAVGWAGGTVDLQDAASGRPHGRLQAGVGRVWSLASGGPYIAAACGDGTVRVWTLPDGNDALCVNSDEARSWSVTIDGAGTRLAASSTNGMVRVWDLPTGRLRWEHQAHAGRIRTLSFDGPGAQLLTGGGDGTARLWDADTGAKLSEFHAHSSWIRTVTLDETGTLAVLGSGPGTITVLDLDGGRVVGELDGHRGRVLALGMVQDGRSLASAAADGTVRLWSLPRLQPLAEVRLDATLHCAAIHPKSGLICAAGARGAVQMGITRSLESAPR